MLIFVLRHVSIAGLCFLILAASVTAAPHVVVSTKPLHSLVAQVMAGVGEPDLLVTGNTSPHTYSLRPSDAAALEAADIVFWTGHGLELFLEGSLDILANDALVVELVRAPGIKLLPLRDGGVLENQAADEDGEGIGHRHDYDDHHNYHHHDGVGDMHFWLDPGNATYMVDAMAAALSDADPDNAATYSANAASTIVELEALASQIEKRLEPLRGRRFIVFHDAFQYFEDRFDLALVGSITVSPEIAPGAQRIEELRRAVVELGAICVFAEPQFEPAIVETVIEGTEAKAGILDPEGGNLPAGRDHYAALLNGLADNLVACLGE